MQRPMLSKFHRIAAELRRTLQDTIMKSTLPLWSVHELEISDQPNVADLLIFHSFL